MKGRIVNTVIIALTVLSCGVRKPAVVPPADIIEFDSSRLATLYYTEALKKSLIEDSLDAALRLLDKAIQADSAHAPSYYEAANILLGLGRADEAAVYGSKAYALDSLNTWYKNLRGRLYIQNEQYYPALEIYRDLVREDPYNPDIYRLLSALYLQENMPLAAISVLDSAEYKIGKIQQLSQMKRELLVKTGQIDRAIAETEAHVASFPYDEEGYLVLADMYGFGKKDSLQLATLKRLLAENPESIDALLSLSEYYQNKGDTYAFMLMLERLFAVEEFPVSDKIAIFSEITGDRDFYRDHLPQINSLILGLVMQYPENYEVIEAYAGHLIAMGEIEHALMIFKSQLEKPDPSIEIYNSILEIEAFLQRPDSVAKYALLALDDFRDDAGITADILLRRGSALQYMEQWDEALKTFRQGIKNAPTDSLKSVFAGCAGDLFHLRGNSRKAFAYYEKALRYDADNAMTLNNYAYYLSENGEQLEKALAMSERSNALSKSNPTYLDTRAWILYKLGRAAEAKPLMQQALSLDRSSSAVLLVHYGDILDALGDRFMAVTYWKRAKEAGYDAAEIDKRIDKK